MKPSGILLWIRDKITEEDAKRIRKGYEKDAKGKLETPIRREMFRESTKSEFSIGSSIKGIVIIG